MTCNDPGSNKYISKLYVNVRNESAALDAADEAAGRTATVGKVQGKQTAITTSAEETLQR